SIARSRGHGDWSECAWQTQPSVASPKVLEPIGCHVGVPNGVLDVLVPEVVLEGARVVAVIRELEPTGMAKHVRVDRKWHLGGLPEALDEAVETDGADNAALGNEYVGILRVLAPQLTQRPHLVTADRMHAGNAIFDAVNVEATLGQLDLLPLQLADLRRPQTMAIGDQDHGRVAMPVAAILAGVIDQPLDLALGEITSFNCQVYDVWSVLLGSRFHRGKTFLLDVE